MITFHSSKIVQTGPDTFEVDGDFTIRGVSKAEKLALKLEGAGTGTGIINGTMAFDRKQYGMNSGIPFIKSKRSFLAVLKRGIELANLLGTHRICGWIIDLVREDVVCLGPGDGEI